MNVALLSSLRPGTGNEFTALRLKATLEAMGHCVTLFDAEDTTTTSSSITGGSHSLSIAIHAYRAGHLLPGPPHRSIVVLSGTDTNVDLLEGGDKASVIARVLQGALGVVCFSRGILTGVPALLASQGIPEDEIQRVLSKVAVIPQAVRLCTGVSAATAVTPPLRQLLGAPPTTPLILLTAGLRAVKDPLFMLPAFTAWRGSGIQGGLTPPILVIVGPPLEGGVTKGVKEAAGVDEAAGRPWGGKGGVFYHPNVPRPALLQWMAAADVCLNTSLSEGQSNALLEAMALGVPVVARHCTGNAALIGHGVNGLLFSTAEGGVAACASLLALEGGGGGEKLGQRSPLAHTLACNAQRYVRAHHSEEAERRSWAALIDKCSGGSSSGECEAAPSPPPPPTYSPHSLASFCEKQLRVGVLVKRGLIWIGQHTPDTIGPVLEVPASTSAPPPSVLWGGKAEAAKWPSHPHLYNFSGGSGGGTSGGTGSPSPSAFTPEGITSLLVQENIVKDGVVHRVGWGRYWEDRNIYTSEHFTKGEEGESRTLHLGVDLEGVAGTPVFAPVSGFVHSVGIDTSELGYGPTIVLEHRMRVTLKASGEEKEGREEEEEEVTFYSLFGHLSRASVFVDTPFSSPSHPLTPLLPVGARVEKGAQIARLGSPLKGENGGWWPHVHFQLNLELGMGGWKGDYPGVCRPCDAPAYSLITCDPNLLLRCPFVQPIGWDGEDKGEDVKVASIV